MPGEVPGTQVGPWGNTAAAWFYLSDDTNYSTVPEYWNSVDFSKVDRLMIGPIGVQADGTFGLYPGLEKRFTWLIERARSQNPGIQIGVSQWWGNGADSWGGALDALNTDQEIQTYANSVADFMIKYNGVSGGLNGYDIDYESNNVSSSIGSILTQVREALNQKLGANGQYYFVSLSPATTQYLSEEYGSVGPVSFVNMQTYAGGSGLTVKDFTDVGFATNQLLYGLCPETNCGGPSVEDAIDTFRSEDLGGIHVWRLNSDDYQLEGQTQAQVFAALDKD